MISSEFAPDQLNDAARDLASNAAFGGSLSTTGGIEQFFEVVDRSGQQVDFTPYTNPANQIGLTAHNRVTVTATCGGWLHSGSIDVQLQGAAVGTDRERIAMATGATYQINAWVTGDEYPPR